MQSCKVHLALSNLKNPKYRPAQIVRQILQSCRLSLGATHLKMSQIECYYSTARSRAGSFWWRDILSLVIECKLAALQAKEIPCCFEKTLGALDLHFSFP
jgi:hypothetical protein